MIFKAPLLLLLLLILPILGKLLARAHRKRNEAAAKLRGKKPVSNVWKKGAARQLGVFALLILALAQPAWNPRPGPLQAQGRDLVIALDISRSMLADDVFPTRLDAAKIPLYESLDQLQGQKLGLITFAGAAAVRVPLTLDHEFIRYMLERAQPSDAEVGSTSLQAAIEKAIDVALNESAKGKQDIILFTDGEDHISNIEKTTEELRECGARVLIIGLGDPVAGAKVPEIGKPGEWMQHKGSDVVTKLDEEKLIQLSAESPNVTYYAARTRPFDLITLYRQMIADSPGILSEDASELVYTEGYPFLIALAILLWLLPLNKRLFATLLLAGCSPDFQTLETGYEQNFETGRELWASAQEPIKTDPRAALFTLKQARAALLKAALTRPGDRPAAEQIAGVSAQIRAVEEAVKEQEEAEKDLQQKLKEAIEQLQQLTQRENTLSQKSQQLLRSRPPVPPEEKAAAVEPVRTEQDDVKKQTGTVTDTISEAQQLIQKMLATAFAEGDKPSPTEFDEPIRLLNEAMASQQTALENLQPEQSNWPQANTAFRSATRQMQEALRLLSDQNQGQNSDESSGMSDDMDMDWDFDEDMEWSESDMPSDMSMPMQSQNFKTALESRSLPTPNYTAEEILMEEAANMEQRAEQQSSRAGAKVEKNW
ncbi:VWA domain-containing protein [Tichowtungia aerotolerans]|uniref:VWA domain-containing protein n=1 Tax=Tichowtungia aerotolerans TaxID=2697043 RepID=A0A6P1M1B5_9BACT|nr:VWA domain-containing protein [Tichowtungia aerotolerans]QHI68609.1 VWA domain-containing protein [Tichowtungia aerotolerans]